MGHPLADIPFASNRSAVFGTRGMVASSQPLATAAGLEILRRGGHAVDAAVATAAALNVTEPNNTGIGGDCFALVFDAATREVTALNGSGRSPAALDLARVESDGLASAATLPSTHAHTVTVPGACAGWCDILERHGRRTIAEVLEPAIALAEDGFPVAPITASLWQLSSGPLRKNPGGAALLVDGRAPRPGERFRNPGLARTLRAVARNGASAFYEGEIAQAVARVVQDHGGVLDESDLREHESTWDTPISTVFRGHRVWECPPNGQGLAALLALNLLSAVELEAQDPLGPDRFHWMIEAMRLAFADTRWYAADPRHPTTPDLPLAELLSERYADERRREIDPKRRMADATYGVPVAGSDTVQFCVVDGDGNACSFINSNYQAFGTGLSPEGFGFTLQNRGLGFSLDPGHPNALAPRKRPYHTIIPGLITREADGSLFGPFGVMGGFMQPQGHLQLALGMLVDGLDPQAALDRPRFYLGDGTAESDGTIEPELPPATQEELAARGQRLEVVSGLGRIQFGRGQAIRRDPDGTLVGGSDPRADGCAMALG